MSVNTWAKTLEVKPVHAMCAALRLQLLLILSLNGCNSGASESIDEVIPSFPVAILNTGTYAGSSIGVDESGNIYITGNFRGTVDFDPGAGAAYLTSAGYGDIFIEKLAPDGRFEWARAMGGTGDDKSFGIAVDTSGNVYTTGHFQRTPDFDPGPDTFTLTSAGGTDMFVSKLDSSGNFLWAKAFGGVYNDAGRDITVDASGNVYISGALWREAEFARRAANLPSGGNWDVFVSKLDSAGNFLWARAMGGTKNDSGRGIAVDVSGNVYTTGWFWYTADFDPHADAANLISAGRDDIFVSKLDSGGYFSWAKALGGKSNDWASSIVVDASGNVYTTGFFWMTADFDPGEGVANLTSVGDGDIFVCKLDSAGNFQWAKAMGGKGEDWGGSIALDTSGNVYTTGYFEGRVDFDPGPGKAYLTSTGDRDIFIQKLDSDGNYLWATSLRGANVDEGPEIAVDMSNNVYISGVFVGTVDLQPGRRVANLTSKSSRGIFIARFSESDLALTTWVNSEFVGTENGSEEMPFNTLSEGLSAAPASTTIRIMGDRETSIYSATMPIEKAVTLEAENGTVRIERDNSTGTRSPGGDGPTLDRLAGDTAQEAGRADNGKSERGARTVSWKLKPEVFVDFGYAGHELGTKAKPFNTMNEGMLAVMEGGTVWFRRKTSNETFDRMDKPMSFKVWKDESR